MEKPGEQKVLVVVVGGGLVIPQGGVGQDGIDRQGAGVQVVGWVDGL